MRLTIRLKLFLAFTLLSIVGGSGAALSLFRLHGLARTYQDEQSQVAVHEAVHEDRIALMSLLNLARACEQQPQGKAQELRGLVESRVQQLEASTKACNGCHGRLPAHVEFTARLEALREHLALILEPAPAAPPAGAVAPEATEATIVALERDRAQMEERLHQLLDRRRESAKTILYPGLLQQIALVVNGLLAALVLAWLMSRAMNRSILPLIAAARRIESRNVGGPVDVPSDPELAEVAGALNEMAARVAQKAREDARRQLLDRIISTQEDERRRVARDLHDTVGQSLSALLMEIRTRSERGESATLVQGDGLQSKVSGLLEEVHRMAWDLRPSLLDDLGLQSALGHFAEEMSRRHGTPVDFQAVGLDQGNERLPGNIETVLYRVAQEALSNVARHSRASRTSVVLVRRDKEAALLVEDDGGGFDVEAVRHDRASLGILGMEERVALVGGNLTIVSAPGKGTSVKAQIPLAGLSR